MDSILISLPVFDGTLTIESANFLGVGGSTCTACTNEPVSCRLDCWDCCGVLSTFEGVLLAILLEAASDRWGGGRLPLLLAASASASSSPFLRLRISSSHSLLR
jgi:hypothetical protein